MAQMNFDKAIAHFAAAGLAAKTRNDRALEELAAGLQRLAEALHHDVEELHREHRESEKHSGR